MQSEQQPQTNLQQNNLNDRRSFLKLLAAAPLFATLGARSFIKDEEGRIIKGGKRHPDVGDHVTIYPNSTILGGKTFIGAGSTIGANVFLMHSVPANSLVVYEEKQLAIHDKVTKKKAE